MSGNGRIKLIIYTLNCASVVQFHISRPASRYKLHILILDTIQRFIRWWVSGRMIFFVTKSCLESSVQYWSFIQWNLYLDIRNMLLVIALRIALSLPPQQRPHLWPKHDWTYMFLAPDVWTFLYWSILIDFMLHVWNFSIVSGTVIWNIQFYR